MCHTFAAYICLFVCLFAPFLCPLTKKGANLCKGLPPYLEKLFVGDPWLLTFIEQSFSPVVNKNWVALSPGNLSGPGYWWILEFRTRIKEMFRKLLSIEYFILLILMSPGWPWAGRPRSWSGGGRWRGQGGRDWGSTPGTSYAASSTQPTLLTSYDLKQTIMIENHPHFHTANNQSEKRRELLKSGIEFQQTVYTSAELPSHWLRIFETSFLLAAQSRRRSNMESSTGSVWTASAVTFGILCYDDLTWPCDLSTKFF